MFHFRATNLGPTFGFCSLTRSRGSLFHFRTTLLGSDRHKWLIMKFNPGAFHDCHCIMMFLPLQGQGAG